jgi:hypothetical protein
VAISGSILIMGKEETKRLGVGCSAWLDHSLDGCDLEFDRDLHPRRASRLKPPTRKPLKRGTVEELVPGALEHARADDCPVFLSTAAIATPLPVIPRFWRRD